MRILIYKRTHTGDPNDDGVFGASDCMGRVRSLQYEAGIGIGGIGAEPRSLNIDGKINWVGIGPHKYQGPFRDPLVRFDRFIKFEANGPAVAALAPLLARRMYQGKVRYMVSGYTSEEQNEAEGVLAWVLAATKGVVGRAKKSYRGTSVSCICRPLGRKSGSRTRS